MWYYYNYVVDKTINVANISEMNITESSKLTNTTNTTNEISKNTTTETDDSAIKMIGEDNTRFVIENITKKDTGYTITANILEKSKRNVSQSEFNSVAQGNEITFRNLKWKIDTENKYNDSSTIYLMTGENKHTNICLRECFEDEGTGFCFCSAAGVDAALCDYSKDKVKFNVSKDIQVCEFGGRFEYNEQGEIIYKPAPDTDQKVDSIDHLITLMNKVVPGTGGYYEQCEAYVSNGKVDAIKIFEK